MGNANNDRDVLVAIIVSERLNGYPPTVRELAETLGFKSSGAMQRRLILMRKAGQIDFKDGSARTITVTEKGLKRCLQTS